MTELREPAGEASSGIGPQRYEGLQRRSEWIILWRKHDSGTTGGIRMSGLDPECRDSDELTAMSIERRRAGCSSAAVAAALATAAGLSSQPPSVRLKHCDSRRFRALAAAGARQGRH